MFRALTRDGKEVFGWLFVRHSTDNSICFILEDSWTEIIGWRKEAWQFGEIEVIPETIAMKTGQTDKKKKDIYGSFELEGFGMTKGGDRVSAIMLWNGANCICDVIFRECGILLINIITGGVMSDMYEEYESGAIFVIIGKQYDEK